MNILGHGYIALKTDLHRFVTDSHRFKEDLIIGALLPESCPFIADNPFIFEEIHEGGEVLLKFLKEKYPERVGLALGMLSHSVKFGADSFNKEIDSISSRLRGARESLLSEIREAVGVSEEVSKGLLHNFLWAGVDFWIFERYSDLVKQISEAIKVVDYKAVGMMLAECFGKDKEKSQRMVETLFRKIYQPDDLVSKEGLAGTYLRQAEGLKFDRQIDFEKTVRLIGECQELMKDEWEGLLREVGESVRDRMRSFIIE